MKRLLKFVMMAMLVGLLKDGASGFWKGLTGPGPTISFATTNEGQKGSVRGDMLIGQKVQHVKTGKTGVVIRVHGHVVTWQDRSEEKRYFPRGQNWQSYISPETSLREQQQLDLFEVSSALLDFEATQGSGGHEQR